MLLNVIFFCTLEGDLEFVFLSFQQHKSFWHVRELIFISMSPKTSSIHNHIEVLKIIIKSRNSDNLWHHFLKDSLLYIYIYINKNANLFLRNSVKILKYFMNLQMKMSLWMCQKVIILDFRAILRRSSRDNNLDTEFLRSCITLLLHTLH